MAMDIRPASALRTEYSDLAARSRATGQPIYITKNGEGDTVLMDLGVYTRREDELRHREAVVQHRAKVLDAEINRLNGVPTCTSDEMREKVRQKFVQARQDLNHV